jgi:fibronectin type 3 domain-containing protein
MKRLSKAVFLFLALFVLTLAPAVVSSAASAYPGNVAKLTSKSVSDTSVKLTWSKASNATGYYVYYVEGNSLKKIATTKNTTCVINSLNIDRTYVFQVYAYKKSGSKTTKSKKGSNQITVKTKLSTPGTVKNFRLVCKGDESAFLAWDELTNADKYILYQYDSETKTYNKIKTTTENNYQVKNLTAGETYYFKIQAYHAIGDQEAYGALSDRLAVKAKSVNVSAVHGRYWTATTKTTVTATVVATGKKVTLKKGTTIAALSTKAKTCTAVMTNGTKITLKGSSLTYGNLYTTKSYYSTEQKEAFVNGKGYSSSTSYLIWISQYTMNTNVFKGSKGAWKLVRSMPCVIGKYGKTTPGVFTIFKRDTYDGQPRLYFTWSNNYGTGDAFHCRINSISRAAASNGCVRLGTSDLQWLASTCPLGTTVVSY